MFFKKRKKAKDPLQGLVKLYEDKVAEIDEKGYPKIWFDCSTLLFNELKENNFHVSGIDFRDGYFIFGMGQNSVVHFHIDECPGWLFGLWWDTPEDGDTVTTVKGQCFAQYEEILDKFKPSRSVVRESVEVHLYKNGEPSIDAYYACRIAEFIQTEPYLAFCRDYHMWNYNHEYHTREEAKQEYDTWRAYHEKRKQYTEVLDKKIWDAAQELFVPLFENAELVDQGDWISPRYELRAPIAPYKKLVEGPGFYGIAGFSDEHATAVAKFDEIVAECRSISAEERIGWFCPLYSSISLT